MCEVTEYFSKLDTRLRDAARSRWLFTAVLTLLGTAALAIDIQVAQWAVAKKCPEAIGKLCTLSEVFADGVGVLMFMSVILVLDPIGRLALPRVAAAAFGAGLAANILKLCLERTRPDECVLESGVWASFGSWFPGTTAGTVGQSFPSAHMATAVGFAVALAWLYPRGRWIFALFAVLAGGQRIVFSKHFVSDVCWGAGIGFLVGTACVHATFLAGAFDRLETWLGRRLLPDVQESPLATDTAASSALEKARDHRAA